MKKLFVDMDGTLARYPDGTPYEVVCQPEYSVKLPPNGNMVEALRMINDHIAEFNKTCAPEERVEIFILSAVLDLPHAIMDKKTWLSIYCEYIDDAHQLFVPYGQSKALFVKEKFGTLTANDFLIDDYGKNILNWISEGGHPIKLFNGINGKSMTYIGDYTCSWLSQLQIVEDILHILSCPHNVEIKERVLNLIDENKDNFESSQCGYDRGYAEGYQDALVDVLSKMGFSRLVEEIGYFN